MNPAPIKPAVFASALDALDIRVGTIEAVVFRERPRQALETSPAAPETRGEILQEPFGDARKSAPKSAGAAAAPPAAREKESDRFAATGIGERSRFAVRWVPFEEEPDPAARIALRYEFRRELVRLGVLSHEEDAFAARERARGFEPTYAPDPRRDR